MILDYETLFADKLAYGGTPVTLDLGAIRPGPGKPLKCFFAAHAVMTSMTALTVLDASVAPADEPLMTVAATAPAAGTLFEFELPSTTQQFVTIAVTGAAAGNYSCGIVLEGNQTNA